jgi:hypothetical protein
MRMAQLVARESAPDLGIDGELAQLRAGGGRRPPSPASGAIDHAKQRPGW